MVAILDRFRFELRSCGKDYSKICKAICAGYFTHCARKDPNEGYRTLVDD